MFILSGKESKAISHKQHQSCKMKIFKQAIFLNFRSKELSLFYGYPSKKCSAFSNKNLSDGLLEHFNEESKEKLKSPTSKPFQGGSKARVKVLRF